MVKFSGKLIYEKKHAIIINDVTNSLYYYFDYDERSYDINMNFQHFHSFFEIHILLCPNAWHLIEGTPYNITLHDFVLLRPSLLHKTEYLKGNPSKRLIINFLYPNNYFNNQIAYETILDPFSEQIPIFRFEKEHLSILIKLLNEIFVLSKQLISEDVRKLMIHQKFVEFLYQFWQLKEQNTYLNNKIGNETEKKIFSITSYIHNHYYESLNLESLSKQFFLSNCYLSHQFKKITGHTLTNYIQMTRIRNAQYLLINTSERITDISGQCGFTSFSQFNRVFRKFCGLSPTEFRKENLSIQLGHENT